METLACSCGAELYWPDLKLIGYQDDGNGGLLELRNCDECGSTRAKAAVMAEALSEINATLKKFRQTHRRARRLRRERDEARELLLAQNQCAIEGVISDGTVPALARFHECDGCKSEDDLVNICNAAGSMLSFACSPREGAIVLVSIVGSLCERQLDPNAALEGFIEHLHLAWARHASERRARIAPVKVDMKTN